MSEKIIDAQEVALVNQLDQESSRLPIEIVDEESAFVATDTLLKVRKLYKEIDKRRTDRTAPANATIKMINADYNQYLKPLAEAEKKLVDALEHYADLRTDLDVKKLDKIRTDTGDSSLIIPIGLKGIPSVEGEVRFKQKFEIDVIDISKVSQKYLSVDTAAIIKDITDAEGNIEIPGIMIKRVNSASIYVK